MEVYLADLVHYVLVVKGDETEAPVSVSHLVVSEHALLHFAELLEVRLNILQTSCCGQSSNKNLLGPHHQLGVGLSGNSNLEYRGLTKYLRTTFDSLLVQSTFHLTGVLDTRGPC